MTKVMEFLTERYATQRQVNLLLQRQCYFCNGRACNLYRRFKLAGKKEWQWVPVGWTCQDCGAVWIDTAV